MGVEGVGAGLGTELFCWYCTKSPSTHAIAGYELSTHIDENRELAIGMSERQ